MKNNSEANTQSWLEKTFPQKLEYLNSDEFRKDFKQKMGSGYVVEFYSNQQIKSKDCSKPIRFMIPKNPYMYSLSHLYKSLTEELKKKKILNDADVSVSLFDPLTSRVLIHTKTLNELYESQAGQLDYIVIGYSLASTFGSETRPCQGRRSSNKL